MSKLLAVMLSITLCLAGCKSAERKVCKNRSIDVYSVAAPPNGSTAWATYKCNENSTIEVWSVAYANYRNLMAHEFIHILARVDNDAHNTDPTCTFHPSAPMAPNPPCAYDLNLIKKADAVYKVRVKTTTDRRLMEAVLWSVSYWNRYAGKQVLEIVRE